jgi:hypothetical protein
MIYSEPKDIFIEFDLWMDYWIKLVLLGMYYLLLVWILVDDTWPKLFDFNKISNIY